MSFSSRGRRQYQRIDDDYDEGDGRESGGFIPFNRGGGNSSYYSMNEGAPLISERASVSFRPDVEENPGPLLMASAAENSPNWDHINDLDAFFRRVYDYHQGGGFACLFWSTILRLLKFVFIIFISTFFVQCIDYDILFNNKAANFTDPLTRKRHFGDAIVPNCTSHLHPMAIICILIGVIYWIFLVIRAAVYLLKIKEIQHFYNGALRVADTDLSNYTWEAIVQLICKAQQRIQLLVHDSSISEIHVYHRILRYKNYMVAMVNQDLLPPLITLPLIGEIKYIPEQLKKNLEWMLFKGFCSPFKGSYTLSDEYRDGSLEDLSERMEKTVMYIGLANLILSPLIFTYQCLYYIFTAADLTKRDSGALGNRSYSTYGRYRVRHFNELDHELKGRLNRSHVYSTAYIGQFNSQLVVIFARNISFIAASIFAPLTALSVWDEDVLQIEHVLTVLTVCGVIALICRSIIPDDNLVFQPEILLEHVSSELHYVPDHWKGNAHDIRIVREFESLFRLRALNLIEEITSPIITPFVLLFYIRPICRALLRFIRDNTERVDGLGDVCTFSLLDIAKHGDPNWQRVDNDNDDKIIDTVEQPSGERAHDGKTEMSCIQFATRHPQWQPPPASANFLDRFRSRMERDASIMGGGEGGVNGSTMITNPFHQSVHTLLSMPLAGGLNGGLIGGGPLFIGGGLRSIGEGRGMGGNRIEGTLERSLRQSGHEELVDSLREQPGAEMRVSSLYLRNIRSNKKAKGYCSIGPSDASMFNLPMTDTIMRPSPLHENDHNDMTLHEEDDHDDDQPPSQFPL